MGLIEKVRDNGVIEFADDKTGHISGFRFPTGAIITEKKSPAKRPDYTPPTPKAQPVRKAA